MNILFADKVMACVCRQPPRGVELFNIRLLQELAEEGVHITVLVHPSWLPHLTGIDVRCLYPRGGRKMPDEIRSCKMLQLIKGQQYDVLLLGNVANRLIGLVLGARWKKVCNNCLVIAHREPSRRVLWAQRVWRQTVVVAVNRQIAGHYARAGFTRTDVYYGITGADLFLQHASRPQDGVVKFCVVGNLENAWKGADTAIAAFRLLPPEVRSRCQLHLASYHAIPAFPEENIIPYGWMSAKDIPGFLAGMDVMLVPSRDEDVMRETFSQVMVQGMLSGLPSIVTQLPILTEKLDQGGGIITDNIAMMAAAMEKLAGSATLREQLGAQARETARQRYIWDTHHFAEHYLCSATRA